MVVGRGAPTAFHLRCRGGRWVHLGTRGPEGLNLAQKCVTPSEMRRARCTPPWGSEFPRAARVGCPACEAPQATSRAPGEGGTGHGGGPGETGG